MPSPDLDRLHLHIVVVTVYVQKHLGGLADAVQRHARVTVRVQGKPGDRVQFKQKRADNPKEIAHHGIGCPGVKQFAEAVADVKRASAMLFNQAPNPAGEAFETAQSVYFDGAYSGMVFDDRRMVAKTKVENLPA